MALKQSQANKGSTVPLPGLTGPASAPNYVAVVLAAGFGTRLRPSTSRVPKPLIPVGGVEPLFFALFKAQQQGLRRAVVNAHYLPEQIEAALVEWAPLLPGLELRCVREEPEILGTGGAILNILHQCRDWFAGAGLLLQNGDTLAQMDLAPLLALAADESANKSAGKSDEQSRFAVSYRADHLTKYNPLWVTSQGEWSGIGKVAPHAHDRAAHFLGVHTLSASAVRELQNQQSQNGGKIPAVDLFNGVYRPLTNAGLSFCAIPYFEGAHATALPSPRATDGENEFWFDMTTQEFLLEAQRHVLSTGAAFWSRVLQARYPGIRQLSPRVWVSGAQPSGVTCAAPAVLVNALSSARMQLGPNATFIMDRDLSGAHPSRAPDAEAESSFRNAVVFSAAGQSCGALPAHVTNQICVL